MGELEDRRHSKLQVGRRGFLAGLSFAGLRRVVAEASLEPGAHGISGSDGLPGRDDVAAGDANHNSVVDRRGLREIIPLDGRWEFQTDDDGSGEQSGWQRTQKPFRDHIYVPGCWQAQGVGEPFTFLRHDYLGWGWYRRTATIPSSWKEKQVWLKISGVARSAKVFVNGKVGGYHNGFSSPFRADISSLVEPGTENLLVIVVDNTDGSQQRVGRYPQDNSRPVGTFNSFGNWGGIWGHVELEATGQAWLDAIHVRTNIDPPVATLNLVVASQRGFPGGSAELQIGIRHEGGSVSYTGVGSIVLEPGKSGSVSIIVPMDGAHLWSPEDPALHTAEIRLVWNGEALDSVEQRFGLREISTKDGRLLLNRRPYYLVGAGDDNIEVVSGTPPVTLEANRRKVQIAKSYGFNCLRFHSRVPQEELFEAADELGILVQAELPVVYSEFLLPHLEFIWSELENALPAYRNHPSLMSLALGNELVPLVGKQEEFKAAFERFYAKVKELHPDILAISSDGWTVPPSDLFSFHAGFAPGQTTIAHEFGGYICSLPDISLAPRFTGVIDPFWMRITENWVKENGLDSVYPELLKGSQRMMVGEMMKFRIEQLRRFSEIQGYDLWLLVDGLSGVEGFIWEEGVLNHFWEPKSVGPEEFSRFNALNVVVSDTDFSERTWWEGSTTHISVYASYYGKDKLGNAELAYSLVRAGQPVVSGKKSDLRVHQGTVTRLADLELSVPLLDQAVEYSLQVSLRGAGGTVAQNAWTYWAYPHRLMEKTTTRVVCRLPEKSLKRCYLFMDSRGEVGSGDLLLTNRLDDRDFRAILEGASAIVFLQPNRCDAQMPFAFFPFFTGLPHAYGSIIEKHPLFRNFPHRGYFDAQCYNLLEGSFALNPAINPMVEVNPMARSVQPLMWCAWSTGDKDSGLWKLGFIYEFRVGQGRVIITSMNFQRYFDDTYPSVVYLFDQLLRYAVGNEFRPDTKITEGQFSMFLRGLHS
ncbi:MAG: sugar-binding domain-containing protein [Terriglobia bacterium]|jgi:hypothetical protein